MSEPITFHGCRLEFDDPDEEEQVYFVSEDTDVERFNADAAKLDKMTVMGRLFRGEYQK